MTSNHLNRKLTPARRLFLEAAIRNGGDIIRPMYSNGWRVGELLVQERMGEVCRNFGWIDAVRPNGPGTNTARLGMGYHYRITDAGRAALGA